MIDHGYGLTRTMDVLPLSQRRGLILNMLRHTVAPHVIVVPWGPEYVTTRPR